MVANFFSDNIVLIDTDTMKETALIEGCSAPYAVKYGPLEKRAFVTCKKVTGIAIIAPDTQTLARFHQLNDNPRRLMFPVDEGCSYVDAVGVATGNLLDRLVNVNKPCCVERLPGEGQTQRVLISGSASPASKLSISRIADFNSIIISMVESHVFLSYARIG